MSGWEVEPVLVVERRGADAPPQGGRGGGGTSLGVKMGSIQTSPLLLLYTLSTNRPTKQTKPHVVVQTHAHSF